MVLSNNLDKARLALAAVAATAAAVPRALESIGLTGGA